MQARGSALLLILALTAGAGAAAALVFASLKPAPRRMSNRALTQLRLSAIRDALRWHHEQNGAFPASLASLAGRGRVTADTLDDPFRKNNSFGYRTTTTNPDTVECWSAGPNLRDETTAGDDIVIQVTGTLAGRAPTTDTLNLLKRVIGQHNTSGGATYGESDLDANNQSHLSKVDEKINEATGKIASDPGDLEKWMKKTIEAFKKAAEEAYASNKDHGAAESPYKNTYEDVKKVEEKLKDMVEESSKWTQSYFDNTLAPKIATARATIASEATNASFKALQTMIVDFYESVGQSYATGNDSFNTSAYRSSVQSSLTSMRSQLITALLEAQGLVSGGGGTTYFLASYTSMLTAVADLGLPAQTAYDAWGTLLTIDNSGPIPVVESAGPDRQAGTADDLRP